jgi:Reverse transcriptase (RNA-dependent DNA polymerase)
VKLPEGLSPPFSIGSGLKQGCPLSPALFGLYFDRLEAYLEKAMEGKGISVRVPTVLRLNIFMLLYADDLILLAETPSSLQYLVTEMEAFCVTNGLIINCTKSKVMEWGTPPKQIASEIRVRDGVLEVVDSFKYLGLEFVSRGHQFDNWIKKRRQLGEAALV